MALKAQSQCRTTIEALSEVKYPKSPTFIRQQNIAAQQQVNNYPAGEKIGGSGSNELIEIVIGERMDSGTASKAIGHDSQLAPLGALNGAGNRRRARAKQAQCVEARARSAEMRELSAEIASLCLDGCALLGSVHHNEC